MHAARPAAAAAHNARARRAASRRAHPVTTGKGSHWHVTRNMCDAPSLYATRAATLSDQPLLAAPIGWSAHELRSCEHKVFGTTKTLRLAPTRCRTSWALCATSVLAHARHSFSSAQMRAVRRHPGVLERTPRGVRKHWRADARHSERDLRKAVCSPSLVALAAPVLFLDHSSCATMQRRTRHVVKQCSARDAALPQDHPASRQPSIAHLRLGQPKRPPVLVCSDASESPGFQASES